MPRPWPCSPLRVGGSVLPVPITSPSIGPVPSPVSAPPSPLPSIWSSHPHPWCASSTPRVAALLPHLCDIDCHGSGGVAGVRPLCHRHPDHALLHTVYMPTMPEPTITSANLDDGIPCLSWFAGVNLSLSACAPTMHVLRSATVHRCSYRVLVSFYDGQFLQGTFC